MARITFPFEKRLSHIFGVVRRPIANIEFWSSSLKKWIAVSMIVDTGADYTLLPSFYASKLGINITRDCHKYATAGIGGSETVYLHPKIKIQIAGRSRGIPVGFLGRNDVPPLLGRQECLEKLKVTLFRFRTTLEST